MASGTAVASPAAREQSMAENNNNSYIPEDIIIQILKRLSLKSLAKANCVSKHWKTLISSKYFGSKTLISTPLQHSFFYQSTANGVPQIHFLPSIPTSPRTHFPNLSILASSNGLVLCGRSKNNPIATYSVWNPISDRLISIPKPKNLFTNVKLGFYSHDSDSFTILRIGKLRFKLIEIFASETGRWQRLHLDMEMDFLFYEGPPAVVLNGIFYWLEFGMIYAFNLFKSEFRKVGFPSEETEYRRIVVSRCLAVAGGEVVAASTDGEVVEIWILQERDSCGLKGRFSVEGLAGINANTLRAEAAADGRRLVEIVGFPAEDSERIYLQTAEGVICCCGVGNGKVEIVHRFDSSSDRFMFFPSHS